MLTVKGVQGHVAYPQLAKNPMHLVGRRNRRTGRNQVGQRQRVLSADHLADFEFQRRHRRQQRDPGEAHVKFNFRFSTASTLESLQTRVHGILDRHGVPYDLEWRYDGRPFLTPKGDLVDALSRSAIKTVTGLDD